MYVCISLDNLGKSHFSLSLKSGKNSVLRRIISVGRMPIYIFSINPFYAFARFLKKQNNANRLGNKLFFDLINRLNSMIKSGMTLVKALKCISSDKNICRLNSICGEILRHMTAGSSFYRAIKKLPNSLNDNYLRIIMCAEKGGYIGVGLDSLCEYIEMQTKSNRQMRSSMIYPATIALLGFFMINVVFFFVLPKFQLFFANNLSADMPFVTKLLFSFADFFKNNIKLMLIPSLSIVYALINPKIIKKFFYNNFLTKKITNDFQIGMFSLNLSMLLKNNIALKEALILSSSSVSENFLCKTTLFKALNSGQKLYQALGKSKKFPHFYIESIKTGESSSSLQSAISKLSIHYLSSYERKLKQFLKLLEPFLILIIAVFVAIIVFALFWPMISIVQSMSFM